MAFSNTPIDVAGAIQESLSTSVSVSGVETPAGSVAVLIASTDGGGAPDTWTASISDDTGGGWNIAGYANAANASPTRSVVAWKQFSTGDTSNTITVGFGAAREWRSLCVAVFSADGVVSQVDYGATNQATLGNGKKDQDINGPSVDANAGDLVVSLIDTYRHCTLTALTGYAVQAVDSPSPQTLAGIASRVAASSGSYGTGFHYLSNVSSQHGYALHGLVLHVDAGVSASLSAAETTVSSLDPLIAAGASVEVPPAATVHTALFPAVTSGASVALPAAITGALSPDPAAAAGAVASPSVAETVMTAVGALVSAGASVLIPVALTAMQAFAPSIGTGGIVAPSPALTSVEALSPAVAGGAQVVPETGRTTVAAFAPMAGSGVAAAAPVARSVVLALEPGVASGAAVQASTAKTRAAAFLPLVGAGAIAQPQVAGTVAHAFPPEVVMGFSVPAAVTRSIALEPEVAGGAAAFPPVARSLARGFDPAAGTGVLVAPLYGATVQNALAPTVAVSVAARPAAARTAALASDPVVAAGANVSAPAARAAVAAFDPAVLASVGVEVEVPVALSRVLTRPPVAYVDDGLPAIAEILVLWGRSASIRIMSSMKTINERTSSAVRVAFRDMDRKPITPLAVEYRIDDEAGVTIRDWSSTPADQELTIEVSDEDNRILNPTRPFETRIMTVRASYGPGKGASEEYRWRVRNLRFQS